ncbi:metallophosphoesterase family protein [Paenibacillus tarimensis]|uniref:metallophosphoesterase family protein n=1 Tax=Paenibacillus tarimensis TaxID=416012 RepID=UPI001F35C26A|nr:metallophosphoesterase family protein [Paenibacillus tarimensis]MCF2946081.1 metallophosphatase family protein [Paenibacillus tarimensis]
MDQIAIISDIHGNMPALEAVLKDIEERGVQTIFCLGDLIGKGPSSDAVVDLIRHRCEQVIQGNWDDFITRPCESETLKWHQRLLGEERLAYLAALPFSIEFMMSGKLVRLYHASPRSLYERTQPWDSLDQRLSLFEGSELCPSHSAAELAGYGDIHNAYLQHLNGKTLFNVGSVGNPLDITQASYVILQGKLNSLEQEAIQLQFVRVPYDIEQSISDAIEAEMPDLEAYSKELRTGIYRGIS